MLFDLTAYLFQRKNSETTMLTLPGLVSSPRGCPSRLIVKRHSESNHRICTRHQYRVVILLPAIRVVVNAVPSVTVRDKSAVKPRSNQAGRDHFQQYDRHAPGEEQWLVMPPRSRTDCSIQAQQQAAMRLALRRRSQPKLFFERNAVVGISRTARLCAIVEAARSKCPTLFIGRALLCRSW